MAIDGPARVLLVEDESLLRESLAELIRRAGFEVVVATDGQEALDHLHRGLQPRLILLDLVMPRMSGWQFREQQLRDPALAGIPLVVITGIGDAAVKARRLGAEHGLEKPLDIDTVLGLVRRYCGPPSGHSGPSTTDPSSLSA